MEELIPERNVHEELFELSTVKNVIGISIGKPFDKWNDEGGSNCATNENSNDPIACHKQGAMSCPRLAYTPRLWTRLAQNLREQQDRHAKDGDNKCRKVS